MNDLRHTPITLSSGRVVWHIDIDKGLQEAILDNDETMTDAEWLEYSDIIVENAKCGS